MKRYGRQLSAMHSISVPSGHCLICWGGSRLIYPLTTLSIRRLIFLLMSYRRSLSPKMNRGIGIRHDDSMRNIPIVALVDSRFFDFSATGWE